MAMRKRLIGIFLVIFQLDKYIQPKGANKNIVDHAIFSKDGPNLNNPADTNRPSVIPNKYKLKKRKAKGRPSFNNEIPNNGEVNSIAGIKPINALIKAVKTRETIILTNFHWSNK